MGEWKTYRLGDIIEIVSGFAYKGEYLGKGDKYLLGMGCVSFNEQFLEKGLRPYSGYCDKRYYAKDGDIVLATRQQSDNMPILGMPAIIPKKYEGKQMIVGANLYRVINKSKDFSNDFIYWLLKSPDYVNYIKSCQTGTTVRMITKANIENYTFICPDRESRLLISHFLWTLENKIELNRRINANLEAQAQALFRSWFVDNDKQLGNYQTKSLTDIAQYLNGLAMQKFPPESIQNSLPVLKIKELGQGLCDASSDRCSTSIKPEYIINDGDVIFSWSGTLLVDVWCGGKCGLNQHLFKVTSDNYPKWFIFYWTKHHLDKFIRIAKDKAVTMGHIKRCDLESSEVKVPEKPILEYLDKIFTPLFDSMITHRIENRKFSALRDTLMPKLMAGEF